LFGAEDETLPPRLVYEDRLWFRRPRVFEQSPDDQAKARKAARLTENRLKDKVDNSTDRWLERLKVQRGGQLDRINETGVASFPNFNDDLDPRRHLPPRMPYDVFAISAYLIEQAGIYHHIQAAKSEFKNSRCLALPESHGSPSTRQVEITQADRDQVTAVADAWRSLSPRTADGWVSPDQLADNILERTVWNALEPLFESWALVFGAYGKASVFRRLSTRGDRPEAAPGWWKHAWRLFAIADEAARGTVFNYDVESLAQQLSGGGRSRPWFETEFYMEEAIGTERRIGPERRVATEAAPAPEPFDISSLSVARGEIVTVLPKVRTPSVGCTLRSLSHHLALTPAYGVARGRWTPDFVKPRAQGALMPDGQMNVLIVPYPYEVAAEAFCSSYVEATPPPPEDYTPTRAPDKYVPRFGYFDVHQHWMKGPDGWTAPAGWTPKHPPPNNARPVDWYDFFVDFLDSVIGAAKRHSPVIHAVVFPELALDHTAFIRVRDYLEAYAPTVELLIAGVSGKMASWQSAEGVSPWGRVEGVRHGNYVGVVAFDRPKEDVATAGASPSQADIGVAGAVEGGRVAEVNAPSSGPNTRMSIREKHHRWKLDRDQLREYGLLGVLSPEIAWWENIPLQSRRVDFGVIRRHSVVAALICEDLARVDPCQQILRSVAPNLTVALLMDAPQRAARWPARYATVLAEDPGTAVLTVTSRGLMARQDRLGLHPSDGKDRIVAMWRDDTSSRPVELNCPYKAQAVVLSVIEEFAEDISLDGRVDDSAMAFRYVGHVPVVTDDAIQAKFAQILTEPSPGS
jgi:hypothetical protein